MNLNPDQIKTLAMHLDDYVENLKDSIEFGGFERDDLERSSANLTEACQLRDLFLTTAKTADQAWLDRATEITV